MNVEDFLQLPKAIDQAIQKGSSITSIVDEAILRTGIGRCYYTAFLKGRDYLGLSGTFKKDIHKVVLEELKQKGMWGVASDLFDLKQLRIKADYYPNEIVNNAMFLSALALVNNLMITIP